MSCIIRSVFRNVKNYNIIVHRCMSNTLPQDSNKFETVFSLPSIKYIALINRLKVYHIIGSCVVIPSCGILDIMNIIDNNYFVVATYIGVTAAVVLSTITAPLRNIIGFLYISDDNEHIKISSVDFWGRRKDKIVEVKDWIPINDMTPKIMDAVYLTPQLTDGTKYKLLVKFGKVLNAKKIGQILE